MVFEPHNENPASSGQLRDRTLLERIVRFVLGRMAFDWARAQRQQIGAVSLVCAGVCRRRPDRGWVAAAPRPAAVFNAKARGRGDQELKSGVLFPDLISSPRPRAFALMPTGW
ncbi:MAG: hypothetical protein SF182_21395 [Deltaproteobacteria bacterium]|nr:hypothetical protein [Deltaproteobacteria bacterium]